MRFLRHLLVVGAFAAIAGTAGGQAPTKLLKVAPSADVQELDPTRGRNLISRIYSQMVFDTLFALDHTLSPKPMMVDKETVSDDRLTYTFTLRSGLKFHNGSPVTTQDVISSLRPWLHGTTVCAKLKSRPALPSATDDRTVHLWLKKPSGSLDFL